MRPMTFLRLTLAATCCVVSGGQFSHAQPTSQPPKGLLFRGRPLPVCKSFFIYEAGVLGRINTPTGFRNDPGSGRVAGTLDVGLMWNRSRTHALGGLLHLGIDGGGSRVSALFRYRRWLADSKAGSISSPLRVDIDAGLVVMTINESIYSQRGLNFSSGIGLNIEDLVALTVRYETYRTNQYVYTDYSSSPNVDRTMPPQTNGTFYFGIKGGSYIGAASSIVAGSVMAVLLIAFSNFND
jgi:hypothetical protein